MNREVGFRFVDSANQFPSLIYEGRPKFVGKVQRPRTKFQSFFRGDRSTRSLTSPLTRSQSTHARSSLALSRLHPHSIKYSSPPPLNPLIYLAVQFLGRRASLSFLFIITPEGERSTNLQPRTLKFRAMYSSSAARSTDDDKWSGFSSPPPATGASVDVDKLLHSDHHSQNTSVVASAQPTYEERDQVQWSSGLCDCLSDRRNCCITCCCPCVTFGQIAEIVDKGSSSCGVNGALYTLIFCTVGCCCCYSCFYRAKMRQQYALKKSPCTDCCVHFWCECCALCQEYRELKINGFNMKIGWHGNVERRSRGILMSQMAPSSAPTVETGMTR